MHSSGYNCFPIVNKIYTKNICWLMSMNSGPTCIYFPYKITTRYHNTKRQTLQKQGKRKRYSHRAIKIITDGYYFFATQKLIEVERLARAFSFKSYAWETET